PKPRLNLAFATSAANKLIAEKIQFDVAKNLGLKLTLQPMELKSLLARLASDPPDLYLLGKSAMFDDPINHLNAFTNSPEVNFSRYRNSEYEKLVELIKITDPGPERTGLARRANQILIEVDVVAVPLLLRLQVFGVSKLARGFQVSPYQVIQLSELDKKEK